MIVKMLFVLFILFVVCLLLVYLHYFPAIPIRKEKYPYALLLGCPSHNDGSYATSQIRRCELAIEAYKKGYFDTLIISGGAVKNEYVESLQMEKYIRKRISMPIVCETKARNTWENFQFTKEKIGDVPVLILSSGTHIRRACAIGKSFFKEYSGLWYPDHKPKHILREIASRCIYISIEYKKKKATKHIVS